VSMQPSTRGSYFLLGSILPRSGRASHVDDLHAGYWKKPTFPPNLVLLFPLHNMTYCVYIVNILRISR